MWDSLPEDVLAELKDPDYAGRTHYRKATYAKGCRGPLCKKLERDEARAETRANAEAAGRVYVPRPPTKAQERDDELARIVNWHERERGILPENCSCSA